VEGGIGEALVVGHSVNTEVVLASVEPRQRITGDELVVWWEEVTNVEILIGGGSEAMQPNWSPQCLLESPSACRCSMRVEQKGWRQCKARIA
jgi:hypothetical protein